METTVKIKKKIWLIICMLCVLGAVILVGVCIYGELEKKEQQDLYENLETSASKDIFLEHSEDSSVVERVAIEEEESFIQPSEEANEEMKESLLEAKYQALEAKYEIEIPRKHIDFQDLQTNTNADIYAWIYVPGTQVDYPILQHLTDDTYYLNYNMDGSKGYPGCIYTETRNLKDFSDSQTVIYGHNMKNGTMFGELHNYEDILFFEEHPYFYVYTPEDIFVYRIYRAYTYSDMHLLLGYNTKTEQGFSEYLNEIKNYRTITSNANEELLQGLTTQDKICTLSTCVKNQNHLRYLVQGVLCDEN